MQMAPPEEYPGLPQNVEAPNHKNNAAETGGNGFGDMNHIYILYNPIINQYRHLKIENVQLRQVWVKSIQPVLGCGVPDSKSDAGAPNIPTVNHQVAHSQKKGASPTNRLRNPKNIGASTLPKNPK